MKEGEDGAPGDQSDEEQPSLRSENSQRPVHGLERRTHSAIRWLRHGSPPLFLCSWKEPGHEVDGTDCHTYAEHDPGEGLLGLAFAVSEHQSSDHDRDQAKT